ncbi:hypothetical protein BJV77DRAFT_976929 [Russula vinacea]|nr:hypothetical protein BJV77DRAFT_976929 [Russula vinacea]
MASRTASPLDSQRVSALVQDPSFNAEPMSDKISAYYSLVFPNFTYYLQTLNTQVDVDLGPLKSVSRLHARIEYEEEEERFVLAVLGRNGAWVDGTWCGKGNKVPLSERSQIQIASRTFHFVLPPPPAPEDSLPPSPPLSPARQRSLSVDITSLSPPSPLPSASPPPGPASPPPRKAPPLPPPIAQTLPNSDAIGKSKSTTGKARKKLEAPPPRPKPAPEDMPPKPPFTYAQLCYRAIKSLGGKATLQEIISWMMESFDWYRFNEKTGWEKSVRHNLSSNRAFRKVERSAGERGKGYYWTVEADCERMFEEQEARAATSAATGGKDSKFGGRKGKTAGALEPPLKRSVRGEPKGTPLPPPLTSTPLVFKREAVPQLVSASEPRVTPRLSSHPPLHLQHRLSLSYQHLLSFLSSSDPCPLPILQPRQRCARHKLASVDAADCSSRESAHPQPYDIFSPHASTATRAGSSRCTEGTRDTSGAHNGGAFTWARSWKAWSRGGGAQTERKEKPTGLFTTTPLPTRTGAAPPMDALLPTPSPSGGSDTQAETEASPSSPIVVVDDDEPSDCPAPKRRRLEVEDVPVTAVAV